MEGVWLKPWPIGYNSVRSPHLRAAEEKMAHFGRVPWRFEVNNQLERDRGLNRKLTRLRAPQDAVHINRCPPKVIDEIISVQKQTSDFSE
jgi:hypothetical protein